MPITCVNIGGCQRDCNFLTLEGVQILVKELTESDTADIILINLKYTNYFIKL